MTGEVKNMLSLIFSAGTPLISLPGWKSPRLIFEAGSISQRWQDSRFFDAYSVQGRLRKFFLRAVSVVLPGRRLQTGTPVSAVDEFAEALPFLRKAVLVGRDDPRQKWIVILLNNAGQPVAFVKYGERERAQQAVLNETRALSGLPSGAGPTLLKAGALGPGVAFVMAPVNGLNIGRDPFSAQSRDHVLQWVACLSVGRSVDAVQHPAVQRWLENEVEGGVPRLQLNDWLATLCDQKLPVGWQHGDATFWNLRALPDGSVRAIDWEDAVEDGCPLFDVVYFVIQTEFFLRRMDAAKAYQRSVEWLCRHGMIERCSEAIVRLAAFDAWVRWEKCGWKDDHPVQLFRKKIWNMPSGM